MKHLSAMIAVAGLLIAPTAASAASQSREPVSVAVSTSDLNLSRPEHVARLRTRIARAVAEACNPSDRLQASTMPDYQCRREMGATAETAMNRAMNRPVRDRVASN